MIFWRNEPALIVHLSPDPNLKVRALFLEPFAYVKADRIPLGEFDRWRVIMPGNSWRLIIRMVGQCSNTDVKGHVEVRISCPQPFKPIWLA